MEKICKICKKNFLTESKIQIYCSSYCKNRRGRKRNEVVEKKCGICGNSFMTAISFQVFCSEECRKVNKRVVVDPKYGEKNRHKKHLYDKKRYPEVRESKILYMKKYRSEHKEERNKKEKEILKNNPKKKLYKKIQTLLARYLKKRTIGKQSRTLEMLEFTMDQFENRLKETLEEGMTWQDFIDGKLQIDHIVPDSWFKYDSPDDPEFKKSWSLDNFQLMWASENSSKGNRYAGKYKPKKAAPKKAFLGP